MVLADVDLAPRGGVELLAAVRGASPTAKRVLLVDWGIQPQQLEVASKAAELGQADAVLTKPTGPARRGVPRRGDRAARRLGVDHHPHGRGGAGGRAPMRAGGPARSATSSTGSASRPACTRPTRRPVGRSSTRPGAGAALPVVRLLGRTVLADPSNLDVARAFGVVNDARRGVRPRGRRRRSRRARRRGVRRLGGSAHRRAGGRGLRRAGRHELDDPQLPRLPGRDHRAAARAAGHPPGPVVRRGARHGPPGRRARTGRGAPRATGRRCGGECPRRDPRLRGHLPPPRRACAGGARRRRRVLRRRDEPGPRAGGRPRGRGRRRELGRPGRPAPRPLRRVASRSRPGATRCPPRCPATSSGRSRRTTGSRSARAPRWSTVGATVASSGSSSPTAAPTSGSASRPRGCSCSSGPRPAPTGCHRSSSATTTASC